MPLSGLVYLVTHTKLLGHAIIKATNFGPQTTLLFSILTISYLFQLIFMSFERVLEVKRNYKELALSYIPYICIVLIEGVGMISPHLIKPYSLITITSMIHVFRIISLTMRVIFAQILYKIDFPIRYAFKVCMITCLITFITKTLI